MLSGLAFLCCFIKWQVPDWGKKASPSGLVPAWAGASIPESQNWAVNQSKNCWQLRRPRAGTEPPAQSSRGCVHLEAKKPWFLDKGHWNRKAQSCGCTPGVTSLTLWLMKDHGAAPTGLPGQARPKDVLHQLQQSSSPAGTGVMDTPCTLENTQMYTSCGKTNVSLDTKTFLRNPEVSPTHRTQMCDGHTTAHGLGQTTDPAVLRKCCLSQPDTSCPEIRRAISKELAKNWHWVMSHNSTTAGVKQRHSTGDATQQSLHRAALKAHFCYSIF